MRTVVIPSDFSENAFNALQYAAELFKYEKSDFFLLHAFAEEIYEHTEAINDEDLARLKKEVCQRSKERLEQNISRIKELFPNPKHNFFTVASFGHLIDELNDLVNKENADITVMGTRGKTSLTFGSNTLQVMKYDLLVMVNSRQAYLENMLSQSTIDKIGMHPIIPFLVLQNYHRS